MDVVRTSIDAPLPLVSTYPFWTYGTLRDKLSVMGGGSSLIIRRDDPIYGEMGSLLTGLFSSIKPISGDAGTLELISYSPSNSFFLVTLLDYLSSR